MPDPDVVHFADFLLRNQIGRFPLLLRFGSFRLINNLWQLCVSVPNFVLDIYEKILPET